jgi:hypothetical protein
VSEPRPPGSQELPPDGPTELVEGTDGEMVERLSNGTAPDRPDGHKHGH